LEQEEGEGATNKKKEKNTKEGCSRSVPIRIVENGGSHFGQKWAL
jgi:hypothetical protein